MGFRSKDARNTWLGSNPGLEFCSLWRLRTNNPAQTSSSSDNAICPTTSPPARRDLWIPPEVLSASSFRADIGERLEARSAGKMPDTAAVRSEIIMVASSTVRSTLPFKVRGSVVGGRNLDNPCAVHVVND